MLDSLLVDKLLSCRYYHIKVIDLYMNWWTVCLESDETNMITTWRFSFKQPNLSHKNAINIIIEQAFLHSLIKKKVFPQKASVRTNKSFTLEWFKLPWANVSKHNVYWIFFFRNSNAWSPLILFYYLKSNICVTSNTLPSKKHCGDLQLHCNKIVYVKARYFAYGN